MATSPRIIELDAGWANEIKAKAIDVLEAILDAGLNEKKSAKMFAPRQYVETYTTCYNMCTQRSPYNWSEQLYVRHGESIAGYLRQTVLAELRSKHKDSQLSELAARWSNHRIMNKWMTRFFMYLDRYYVKHHSLPTLDAAGLKHFKEIVYDEVKRDCMTSMITLVDEERDGGTIDADLIKKCVELFEAMGMGTLDAYTADFEEHLLEATKEYYARKSELWIAHDDTPSYMLKAEEALQQEKERVQKYFNSSSEPKLLRVVEQEILEKRETVLLEKEGSGCKVLLQNDKVEDLSRMFRLFSRIPEKGLPPIAAIVKAHIEDAGGDVLDKRQAKIEAGEKDTNSDPTFIKDLLALHDKYTSLVNDQFGNNSLFQKALKEAFVDFVNRDVGKHTNADLMSSFCDRILKTGGEKLSDEDIEAYLEKTVKLFSYLTDKDLFSEIYRNQLAKRLLNQRSASDDAERIMIGKLKLLCGSQFTGKMEGMLNDLNIGVDHQTDFASHVKDKGVDVGKIDFSVQVLTTGYWPTYPALDVHLPAKLSRCTQVFREYYDEKNSKRRLAWMWGLGNVTLRGLFGKKSYDINVTTLQAIALLAFNGAEEALSYEVLRDRLNLPDEIMKRVLHSLACGKFKCITKAPKGNSVKTGDTFSFNADFKCPMRKIRIPMASLDETHNPKRVEEDRSVAIEAAIVRIMKARKTLTHQQLVAEVLSQLAFFRPNPKKIKQRIEALIDREYLERDNDVANTYKYLA